jgi:isopentenyldiphosphate isomerase
MMIDVVDDHDHPIGQMRRSTVFSEKANFRVAHVLIFNAAGNLLIQQLSAHRERHPLKWGSSVASYIPAGESYRGAAQTRVAEELGIPQLTLSEFGRTVMVDNGCRKFIGIFVAAFDGDVTFDARHIAAVRFASIGDLVRMAASANLTPTFLHVLRAVFSGPTE